MQLTRDDTVATGIGFETSRAFAAAGVSNIHIISRREGPLVKAKKSIEAEYPGVQVSYYPASVSDREKVRKIIQDIGHVDFVCLSGTCQSY
jgi:short-subunit dehydrogenase